MGLINMYGKILKVSNNDLNGNVDDRQVAVYAAFKHNKYMNRYVVFSFVGEYNKCKLYLGSVHLKANSLVIFAVRDDEFNYINKFVNDYLNNVLDPNEYEIIDISGMEKIELVSYSEEDFTGLEQLDQMAIKRENVVIDEEPKNKKPVLLYVLLVVFILLLGGVTYLYLNPSILDVNLKELNCTMDGYDKKLEMDYKSNVLVRFDRDDKLVSVDREDTYKFTERETYQDFKDNNKESVYFGNGDSYKYDDNSLELKLISSDKLIIDEYEEVSKYFKNKGYSCIEGIYHE